MKYSAFILFLGLNLPALGQDMAQSTPRTYMSLKTNEVNVRAGPGTQYPILWVFRRSGYPVEKLATYESWFKIRDPEGEEGWVYRNLLSSRRTVVVSQGDPAFVYKTAEARTPLYQFEQGVIAELEEPCGRFFCHISSGRKAGWILKRRLLMGE